MLVPPVGPNALTSGNKSTATARQGQRVLLFLEVKAQSPLPSHGSSKHGYSKNIDGRGNMALMTPTDAGGFSQFDMETRGGL